MTPRAIVLKALTRPPEIKDPTEAVEAFNEIVGELLDCKKALRKIASRQQIVLRTIERNGFVFTSLGSEPGNWEHLAFSLYSDICEIDMIARGALGKKVGE